MYYKYIWIYATKTYINYISNTYDNMIKHVKIYFKFRNYVYRYYILMFIRYI